MKIFITTPSFAIHGGIRIILEWANRLTKWHDVTLFCLSGESSCDWFNLSSKIKIVHSDNMKEMDCLIITSPHSIYLEDSVSCPKKVFIFAQMAEHLFNPTNKRWFELCKKFYTSNHPMFSISEWNIKLFSEFGRTAKTHYIRNGVNFIDFPISYKSKDMKTILVEGWECTNPSKDSEYLGPRAARKLRDSGYYIIAFSQKELTNYCPVPHEYYVKPSLEKMNELYERATIMIKATKFDARSCAPMEAMTKGTVTFRAIDEGDDDLINAENCIKIPYSQLQDYSYNSVEDEIVKRIIGLTTINSEYLSQLSNNARKYVQNKCGWDEVIWEIHKIISE